MIKWNEEINKSDGLQAIYYLHEKKLITIQQLQDIYQDIKVHISFFLLTWKLYAIELFEQSINIISTQRCWLQSQIDYLTHQRLQKKQYYLIKQKYLSIQQSTIVITREIHSQKLNSCIVNLLAHINVINHLTWVNLSVYKSKLLSFQIRFTRRVYIDILYHLSISNQTQDDQMLHNVISIEIIPSFVSPHLINTIKYYSKIDQLAMLYCNEYIFSSSKHSGGPLSPDTISQITNIHKIRSHLYTVISCIFFYFFLY